MKEAQWIEEAVEKLSSLIKTSFSKRGKKHKNECNQASYSTKDPNNILSSQKHLLTQKCKAFMIQNTHTHTLNKSNQFYISKTSQNSLVSIH